MDRQSVPYVPVRMRWTPIEKQYNQLREDIDG